MIQDCGCLELLYTLKLEHGTTESDDSCRRSVLLKFSSSQQRLSLVEIVSLQSTLSSPALTPVCFLLDLLGSFLQILRNVLSLQIMLFSLLSLFRSSFSRIKLGDCCNFFRFSCILFISLHDDALLALVHLEFDCSVIASELVFV
jgi:hypothetical protein